jgi:hypothetical protein
MSIDEGRRKFVNEGLDGEGLLTKAGGGSDEGRRRSIDEGLAKEG